MSRSEVIPARRSEIRIFRGDAVHRYGLMGEIFPRPVAAPSFLLLWLLLGLLAAGGMLAWLARVPVYASGAAVIADPSEAGRPGGGAMIVAFLPAEHLSRLKIGQMILFRPDAGGKPLERRIAAIELEATSPEAARQRFEPRDGALEGVNQPVVIAIAPLGPVASGFSPAAYAGSTGRVEVQVGSRRVLSLAPGIGRLIGE
jgi:hypothetical protein